MFGTIANPHARLELQLNGPLSSKPHVQSTRTGGTVKFLVTQALLEVPPGMTPLAPSEPLGPVKPGPCGGGEGCKGGRTCAYRNTAVHPWCNIHIAVANHGAHHFCRIC